ncbi:MAG: C10 family peptidase [Bacteroidales bacterium]|nr:C10 family peptidase [Bacteroidales bacterium]
MKKKPIILAVSFLGLLAVSCSREYLPAHDDGPAPTTPYRYGIRSAGEAVSIAQESLDRFYPGTKSEKGKEVSCIIPYVSASTKGTASDTLFYIVNFGENEGFALVAANPAVSPLLVITESGRYEGGQTDNDGFNIYMESLIAQLSQAPVGRYDPIVQPDIVDTIRSHASEYVSPMLQSAWHQDPPFGDLTPNGLAGCAAVALGQIMAYYEHPDTLHLTYPGSSGVLNLDWPSMITHNSGSANSSSTNMKNAQLMRELGERLSMIYGDESYTTTYNVYSLLPSLGFTSGVISYYSKDGLRHSLMQDNPALISAFYSTDIDRGHIWVVDGYQYDDWSYDYYYFRGFNLDGSMNLQFGAHDERTTYYFHFNLGHENTTYNGYYIAYDYANQYGVLFPVAQYNTTLVNIFTEMNNVLPHSDVIYIPSVRINQ